MNDRTLITSVILVTAQISLALQGLAKAIQNNTIHVLQAVNSTNIFPPKSSPIQVTNWSRDFTPVILWCLHMRIKFSVGSAHCFVMWAGLWGPNDHLSTHTASLKYLTSSSPIIISYISFLFHTQASRWQLTQTNRAYKIKNTYCKASNSVTSLMTMLNIK